MTERPTPPPPGTTFFSARVEVEIAGTENAWRVARGGAEPGRRVPVELTIESDGAAGFHLVMSPRDHFTADTWSASVEEAMEDALEAFGIRREDWKAHAPAD